MDAIDEAIEQIEQEVMLNEYYEDLEAQEINNG
jgi:hypothetical protein